MARKRQQKLANFDDIPEELQAVDLDSPEALKDERNQWVESNGLSMVDYFTWERDQLDARRGGPIRPPARRKLLTPKQRAELDAQREQEGEPEW